MVMWLYKKKHGLCRKKKKKISFLYRDETTIFVHGLYGEKLFFFQNCAILKKKIKGVSIFVCIPHCPMVYCFSAYSTFLYIYIEQGFSSNSVE